jgi:hypothetical protein
MPFDLLGLPPRGARRLPPGLGGPGFRTCDDRATTGPVTSLCRVPGDDDDQSASGTVDPGDEAAAGASDEAGGDTPDDGDGGRARQRARPSKAQFTRRRFVAGVAAGLGLTAAGAALYPAIKALEPGPARPRRALPTTRGSGARPGGVTVQRLASGVDIPVAAWVVAENALPGTLDWLISPHPRAGAIEGYADAVSAPVGSQVTLRVDTAAPSFHVEAYRMGYYGGLGARLVTTSPAVAGVKQPAATVVPGVNMVECDWSPSVTLPVSEEWPPGDYLLKLVGSDGAQGYVPLCVRDETSTAAFVIQNSVTTWQAYNRWGKYSLYYGPGPQSTRSRVVSFDRPYLSTWAWGAADFIGNEFPVVHLAERLGLDVTYRTDVDLHADPGLLLRNRCLLSLGHDEYWSTAMRDGALAARDAGVNLCFLGANPVYRHIRFEDSPLGRSRHQVCYKTDFMRQDPLWGVDPAEVTANWSTGPVPWPEQQLVGNEYQDVDAAADAVVVSPDSWLFDGLGLEAGSRLPNLVFGEYDRFVPGLPGPRNVAILAHSPVANRGPRAFSDITYYSAPSDAGVLAVGTASFVNWSWTGSQVPTNVIRSSGKPAAVAPTLERMMLNVFSVMGAGPAGASYPSTANWEQFDPPTTAPR